MASRQRARAPKKERKPNQLADLGIFGIPDLDAMGVVDDTMDEDNESDLESELESILSGRIERTSAQHRKKVAAPVDIQKMAADCLKDDFSDENSDDEGLTDPDLLNELQRLSCESPEEKDESKETEIQYTLTERETDLPAPLPSQKSVESIIPLLQERLQSYNDALSAAKTQGDNSKVRRYGRGIKTLENLIKSAESGKVVNSEDIPPVVSIPKQKAPIPEIPHPIVPSPTRNEASKVPATNVTDNLIDVSCITERKEVSQYDECLTVLKNRRQKYKMAALQAKKAGDKVTALEYMRILKTFDAVIENTLKDNELVDISSIPPSPPLSPSPQYKVSPPDPSKKEREETQTSSMEAAALSAASEPEDPTLFAAPPPPNSVLEALQQRLEKFSSTCSAAEAEGNVSKARRLQRIVKLYEKALKDYKAGKQIAFEELPTPPGFAPIPIPTQSSVSPAPSTKIEKPVKNPEEAVVSHPKRPAPEVPSKTVQPQKPKVQRTNTLGDRQLEFLLERQRLFREAALASKKSGNMEQAKEYLRMSKGFDSMIEATKCGLPINTNSIPTPPQLAISDSDFVVVDRFECGEGSDFELFDILHKDLTKQIEMCKNNKEHFMKLGDVSSASKFEKLGLESQKDLSIIFHLRKAGQPPPKFHYETRMFSIVQCNADLTDEQLEVTVERGINFPGKPEDLNSYVKVEFPIPTDAPQKAKTNVIRDTNNPIFQEEFKFIINRKSRAQLRQFKRQVLKLEIFSKGGFLRSDSLLGVVSIKLIDLESTCTIHDCFDLMDGRKMTGGKLECKIRIRQPLLVKQVEQVQEKWLVVGS